MCLNASDVSPLCDECWDKSQDMGSEFGEKDLCDECKSNMERYCGCCNVIFGKEELKEADLIDNICKSCREMMIIEANKLNGRLQ